MTIKQYQSRPSTIEAVQHTGDFAALEEVALHKVRIDPATGMLELRAGMDGAQGWVPVPTGHWIVRNPGDANDLWPVDPEYFANKYIESGMHA
jgi:hypothetical protein